MKQLRYGFNDPLNEGDTEFKTVGCRAFQPDYCADYGSNNCALTNESGVCLCPRKSWKKQYCKLKGEKNALHN